MNTNRSKREAGWLLLGLLCSACATDAVRGPRLPFHVAIVPPVADQEQAVTERAESATDLALAFDVEALAGQLEESLRDRFAKVTRLRAAPAAEAPAGAERLVEWRAMAQASGADLILIPRLIYDPRIYASLNDRFWLNLPLFALGGPFCWFVGDRSYYCDVRLRGELCDVMPNAAGGGWSRAAASLALVERSASEAALNFLDRADGVAPFLLSFVCPAGLVWPESEAIPGEMAALLTAQLCAEMAQSIQDHAPELTGAKLVAFYPQGLTPQREGDRRWVEGAFVLELGTVQELGSLRYRFDQSGELGSQEWQAASWLESPPLEQATGHRSALRQYPFRIEVPSGALLVQFEVEQLDRFGSKRTFTYALSESEGKQ